VSRNRTKLAPAWVVAWLVAAAGAQPGEPVARAEVKAPPAVAPDEPLAKAFSAEQAARYLDAAALNWLQTKNCAACHTPVPYMMARAALTPVSAPAPEVRQFFEDITTTPDKAFPAHLPADARTSVVVVTATALALDGRATTGKLHPLTRKAFDRMWAAQRPDGGWDWPFRDVPPIKDTEHYGVTFAALGAGLAPEGYAESEAARKGLERVRKYLKDHLPTTLHERAMLLACAVRRGCPDRKRAGADPQESAGGAAAGRRLVNGQPGREPPGPQAPDRPGQARARREGARRRVRNLRRPR